MTADLYFIPAWSYFSNNSSSFSEFARAKDFAVSIVSVKEFFASNPEIFTIAETEYYESLSPEKYGKFVEKCTKLSKKANEKWHSQREKIEEFDEALGVLKSIFRTKKATEDFSAKIRQGVR